MNKVLVGILVTGAAVAAGYAAVKLLKGKDSQPDYDDDIYDYPDPYDTDESIDFEINDDSAVKDLADDVADKAEDVVDDLKDAAGDIADTVKETAEEITDEFK